MNFEQYPDNLRVRILEDDDNAQMGAFSSPDDRELKHVVLTHFNLGTRTGSETLKINIYGDLETDSPLYTSNTITYSTVIAAITGATTSTNNLGTIRFDFTNSSINKNTNYYLRLQVANYTRNGNSSYLAYVLDHPAQINVRSVSNEAGAQAALVGLKCL